MQTTSTQEVEIQWKGLTLQTFPLNQFQIFPYFPILHRDILDHNKQTAIDLANVLTFQLNRPQWIIDSIRILMHYDQYQQSWDQSLIDPRPYWPIIDVLADFFLITDYSHDHFLPWLQYRIKNEIVSIKHGRKLIQKLTLSDFKFLPCYQNMINDALNGLDLNINLQSIVAFKLNNILVAIDILLKYPTNTYFHNLKFYNNQQYAPYIRALAQIFMVPL